jgi:hypothetical protein
MSRLLEIAKSHVDRARMLWCSTPSDNVQQIMFCLIEAVSDLVIIEEKREEELKEKFQKD